MSSSNANQREAREQYGLPPHVVALRYVHGDGQRPSEEQMGNVNKSLYDTVLYVDEMKQDISDLNGQIAELNRQLKKARETPRATPEHTGAPKTSSIEVISKSREEILGTGKPCGQILRVTQPDGRDIYAMCIIAGMSVYDGKCPFHSHIKKSPSAPSTDAQPSSPQAPQASATSVAAIVAATPTTPEMAPVSMSYSAAAQACPDKK